MTSAAIVVSEHGYAGASVARITEAAGLATGTFYVYFPSRQALFDELMPEIGLRMIAFIGERVKGASDFFDVEERGIRAFLEFLGLHPGLYRIFNEAEYEAPQAHATHLRDLQLRYRASLRRAIANGQVRSLDRDEIETVVSLLVAARNSFYQQFALRSRRPGAAADKAVATYMQFLRQGLA